jgi:uncharacterized protein DUF7005
VVEEVLRYGRNPFGAPKVEPPVLPLADEPHVADWRRYAADGGARPFEYLQARLPQLAIPVAEGVSARPEYKAVTLRGQELREVDFGGTLRLRRPQEVRLLLHGHPAGALPVLLARDRDDFETLVRALAWRGEPRPISPAVNAQIVTGFINWERLRRYRAEWTAAQDPAFAERIWPAEMNRVTAFETWRFLDRFIITCERPYSGVAARELGLALSEEEWLARSTLLRVEHEFTHYATHRVFGTMSLNLLDETIADFMGTTYALGGFEAAWFLRFLGLEAWPEVRPDGRIRTYTTALSPAAFALVCAVTVRAAQGLAACARRFYDAGARPRFFVALASLSLELLAAEDAVERFGRSYEEAGQLTTGAA